MYLSLEVERKEIIGKIKQDTQRNMFLLKEIIMILDQFYTSKRSSDEGSQKIKSRGSFCINEDKLIKILLLKSLKLKLQRDNFSFGPTELIKLKKGPAQNHFTQKQKSAKDSGLELS